MLSRSEMMKEVGFRRSLRLAGTSVVLYASMMLAVSIFTQPAGTGDALMTLVTPAAQASDTGAQAAQPADRSTPAWGERTVYFPESLPPVAGGLATPIEQF